MGREENEMGKGRIWLGMNRLEEHVDPIKVKENVATKEIMERRWMNVI